MTRDITPVAAALLERLIHDSEPSYAITTLSTIWSARANPDLPQFGLSPAEYVVQLCLIYAGEVGNGRHSQYFLNRGGRLIPDTVAALHDVGLPELEATLVRAAAQFPNGKVPDDFDEAEQAFGQLTGESLRELERLDTLAFRGLPGVDGRLLAYVRMHEAQILVPETPVASRDSRPASGNPTSNVADDALRRG